MAILPKPNSKLPITARKRAFPSQVAPAIHSEVKKEIPKAVKPVVKPKKKAEVPAEKPGKLAEDEEKILELINRRQRQVIVHSVIYYRFDDNLVSDHTYTQWAFELADLMKKYPDIAKQSVFWGDMKDFVGHTGFDKANHPWGVEKAQYLIQLRDKWKSEGREFVCL